MNRNNNGSNRDTDFYEELTRLNNELVNLQRQIAKKNSELERLNTLKTQFLGMAAHDLRRPLSAIIAYSEFVHEEARETLSDEHRDFMVHIIRAAWGMKRLIDDFLNVAMIESGKLVLECENIKVKDIIDGTMNVIGVLARSKRIDVLIHTEDPGMSCMADGPRLEQALVNLLSNAVEHSETGSSIHLNVKIRDEYLVFSVKDEAGGIPGEELNSLFEDFTRAGTRKTAGERSVGLGLAIVKRIVDAHGGNVSIDSIEGVGSTFAIRIPTNHNS